MADFSLFAPFVFRWEGGFSNDPADRGKATNMGVTPDGVVGNITLRAVNTANPAKFHARLLKARIKFIHDIIRRDPTQARFKNGWMRRAKELGIRNEE